LNHLATVERERKKAEKQAKFDQKNAKKATATPAASSKNKEKKAKAEKKAEDDILPPYVEETPVGEKKSMSHSYPIFDPVDGINLVSSNKIFR
jgi:valyl-tRNA synthetase